MLSKKFVPEFIDNLTELAKLDEDARIAIALAEAYNPGQKSFLGLHNEMRNALSHVMEMVRVKDKKNKCNSEFRGASSHFRRAGCDAYELLCISCIKYIEDLLSKYDHEDINIVFPAYYTEIRKTAIDVGRKVAEIKLNKDLIQPKEEDLFEYFFNQADILIKCVKKVNEHIPAIIEIQKKKKKNKQKELFLQVGIAIVIAVLFFILGLYIK